MKKVTDGRWHEIREEFATKTHFQLTDGLDPKKVSFLIDKDGYCAVIADGQFFQEKSKETKLVVLGIPNPYNGGEYRLSMRTRGPRGEKKWETIYSTPATGGKFSIELEPGDYKETWWANGWPKKLEWSLVRNSDGVIIKE